MNRASMLAMVLRVSIGVVACNKRASADAASAASGAGGGAADAARPALGAASGAAARPSA